MKKYIKKSLFTILAVSLICTMFNVSLTQGVNAIETEKPDVAGLELKKTATPNGDGTYKLQLEAYATGKLDVITKSKPLDIVMVLDQSGSMDWGIERKSDASLYKYIPIYHDDGVVEGHDNAYYVKNASGNYIEVKTYKDENGKPEMEFPGGITGGNIPFPVYIWREESATGKSYVPLKSDLSSPLNHPDHVPTQFYRKEDKELEEDYTGPKRIDVLKQAAKQFIDNVDIDGGDHRMAVVGYANGEPSFQNTELFIGEHKYRKNSTAIEEQYKNAFQLTKESTGKENLKKSIDALTAAEATRSDLGMEMAKNIFEKDINTESDREKVVIMFTDGKPTDTNVFSENVANRAIEIASEMKNNGAKVFTVGVENTLDVDANPSLDTTNEMNKYMQYVSSNYPNAKSLTDAGEGDYKGKKFLSANDEESLLKVFEEIREEISSSTVALDAKTQMVDFVSDYFEVVKNEGNIKVFTQNYIGMDSSGYQWNPTLDPYTNAKITFDEEAQKISVSGFDYSTEYIIPNGAAQGRRLVLQIDVKVKDGFIGGKYVPTNKNTAGIYDGDNVVENFDVPEVKVDLDFEAIAKDKSVYVATSTGFAEDIFDADLEKEGIQYTLNKNNYDFDGINNKFVDVVYDVKVKGEVIATYSINAGETVGTWTNIEKVEIFEENTEFTVEAKVSYVGDTNVTLRKEANAQINVFTPVVKTVDSTIFKGEEVNLENHITSVEWISENKSAPIPSQKAPEFVYGFTGDEVVEKPKEVKVYKTTMYSISMKNEADENIDYTKYATFKNTNNHQDGHFRVNVVSGELEIVKTIDAQYTDKPEINAEQSFKFKIERSATKDGVVEATYYQTIQFSANQDISSKSIILKGLSKGYYTVTEVNDWSWKYEEEASKRKDNYIGNGTNVGNTENSSVYIGNTNHTNGKKYYGSANGTLIDGEDQSYPAQVNFYGKPNKFIVGDAASAINKFTK